MWDAGHRKDKPEGESLPCSADGCYSVVFMYSPFICWVLMVAELNCEIYIAHTLK